MNANELADELEKSIYEQIANINFHDVAEFIRKQDSSIDKHILAEENLREYVVFQGKQIRQQQAEIQALKSRELTDEEIIKTMVQFDVYSNDDQCLIEAGRAILRKAQEK